MLRVLRPLSVTTVALALVAQTLALLTVSAAPAAAAPLTPLGLEPGDIVIADSRNNRLVVHPADGGPDRVVTADLHNPRGVAVTPDGDIVVADQDDDEIVRIPADGSDPVRLNSNGAWGVSDVALDGNGHVLFTGTGWGGIGRVPLAGGRAGNFVYPGPNYTGVAVASDGDLVASESGADLVYRMDPDGSNPVLLPEVSNVSGSANDCFTPRPCELAGLALTRDDRVVVADVWNGLIWERTGAGSAVRYGDGEIVPTAVAVDPDGTVYATDLDGDRVVAFAPGSRARSDVVTGLRAPGGLAIVPDLPPVPPTVGTVFLGTASGDLLAGDDEYDATPATYATGLGTITGVAIREDGTVLVGNAAGRLLEVGWDGYASLVRDFGAAVQGLAVAPDGTVHVAVADGAGSHRWRFAGGTAPALDEGASAEPITGLDVTSTGDLVVARADGVRIGGGPPLDVRQTGIAGVAWHPKGWVYTIADFVAGTSLADGSTIFGGGWPGAAADVAVSSTGGVLSAWTTTGVYRANDTLGGLVRTTSQPATAIATYVPVPQISPVAPAPGAANVGTPYSGPDFDATDPGGLGVTFSLVPGSDLPDGVTLDPTTGEVSGEPTEQGTFSYRVQAANPGRGSTSDEVELVVGRRVQTVTFTSTAPTSSLPLTTYTPTATATSGGPVTFSVTDTFACTYRAGVVTFQAGGTCTIRADQAGDADHLPAFATQEIFVDRLLQTVSFSTAAPTNAVVGGTYTPAAVGLPSENRITFTPASPFADECSVDEDGVVHFDHVGTCRIRATVGGDTRHYAATATQSFTIAPGELAFRGLPTDARVGDGYVADSLAGDDASYGVDVAESEPGVCSEDWSDWSTPRPTIRFDSAGTCVVFVAPNSTDDWDVDRLTAEITVGRAEQTLTFTSTAPSDATVGGDYTPVATTTASGPVSFVVPAGSADVCRIVGARVVFEHVGTCVVRAEHPGDDDVEPGWATQTIVVGQGSQTISFLGSPPTGLQVGDGIVTNPSATSGLPVVLTVAPESADVCYLAGGTLELAHAGVCTVHADQAGDDDWLPALRVTRTLTVGPRDQWVVFDSAAPTGAVVGDTYTPEVFSTSGLSVELSVAPRSAGVCSVDDGVVTFEHVGDCEVRADQPGDADTLPAAQAVQTIVVGRAGQTIVLTSPPTSAVVGQTYDAASAGSATSGLPVEITLAPDSAGVCSLAGGILTFDHVGDCVVRLDQLGDADYTSAPRREFTVLVGRAPQTIVFTSTPSSTTVGGSYAPTAVGGASGNPVVFTLAPSSVGVCSLAGGTVTFDAAGTCVVRANQAGDADHLAAPQAEQVITVGLLSSSVTFLSVPGDVVVGQSYVPVLATSPSAGGVDLSVSSPGEVCRVAGGLVTFDRAGQCTIVASFGPSDARYGSSTATQTIEVDPAATTTGLALQRDALVATVSVVEPGGGVPQGAVEFSVDGVVVGSADLEDVDGERVAVLTNPATSTGAPLELEATYVGSADHLGSTSEVVTRTDPVLRATRESRHERTRFGWYRSPVTITFSCEEGSAPLVGECPGPLRMTGERRGQQPISVAIDAEDGGRDQVDLTVRIDRTDPTLRVRGVRTGATYTERQQLRCVARDRLSGVATCTREQQRFVTPKGRAGFRYVVTALDRAGNRSVERGRYFVG